MPIETFNSTGVDHATVNRWANALILCSNHRGEINKKSFMLDWVFSETPPTEREVEEWQNNASKKIRDEVIANLGDTNGNIDIVMKELIRYLDAVRDFLLVEGYINEPKASVDFWTLSDRGKTIKEYGSIEKYKERKRQEDEKKEIDYKLVKKQLEDYPKVKLRANLAILLAALSLLANITLIYLRSRGQ